MTVTAGHDPYANAGVAEATEERQRKREKANRTTFETDLKWVMSGPRGRRLINWLAFDLSGLRNDQESRHDEGMQRVGRELHRMLEEHCLEDYFKMRQEALHPDEHN